MRLISREKEKRGLQFVRKRAELLLRSPHLPLPRLPRFRSRYNVEIKAKTTAGIGEEKRDAHHRFVNALFAKDSQRWEGGSPTNIGNVRCTVSVATIVVVSAGVDI